jgi:predicted NUDIX family NTP pyrophosphohydrolase
VKKDIGAWSIPKGEFTPEEDPLEAAKREFQEETGFQPSGIFKPLHPAKQKSGKIIFAWMAEGDFKAEAISSNEFEMEWPPRSGKFEKFPEVDYASWLPLDEARIKIVPGQLPLLDQLERMLDG